MGGFLILAGFLVNAVFGVVIIVKAFRVSTGWGLAVMFLPFAGLFFVLNHWADTKNAFLGGIAGMVLVVLGVIVAPEPERADDAPETRSASRSSSRVPEPADDDGEPQANYASAAAVPVPAYEPPRTYTPAYNPPQPLAPPVATDTQAEDEWTRKPVYEQVYVDRATNTFYLEKCKKRPENVYRIPRSVALMQGMTEAKCR